LKLAKRYSPKNEKYYPEILDCYVHVALGEHEYLDNIEKYTTPPLDTADAWLWKGNIYFDILDDYKKADDCYGKIWHISYEACKQRGILWSQNTNEIIRQKMSNEMFQNSVKNATLINHGIVTLYPDDYIPHLYLGRIYNKLKNGIDLSIFYLTKSIEKHETLEAYVRRCLMYQKKGDMENVKRDIERGIAMTSNITMLCESLCENAIAIKNYELILMWIEEGLKHEPNNGDLYYLRGFVYEMTEKKKEAIDDYKKAIELNAAKYFETAKENLKNYE
jgi:tetratricopeptide (TPR) repeat protein